MPIYHGIDGTLFQIIKVIHDFLQWFFPYLLTHARGKRVIRPGRDRLRTGRNEQYIYAVVSFKKHSTFTVSNEQFVSLHSKSQLTGDTAHQLMNNFHHASSSSLLQSTNRRQFWANKVLSYKFALNYTKSWQTHWSQELFGQVPCATCNLFKKITNSYMTRKVSWTFKRDYTMSLLRLACSTDTKA